MCLLLWRTDTKKNANQDRHNELTDPVTTRQKVTDIHDISGTATWQVEARKARQQLGVAADTEPWTDLPHVRMKGVTKTPFHKELLNLAWMKSCVLAKKEFNDLSVAKNLFIDLSQHHERKAYGAPSKVSLGQNTDIYSFEMDASLHPKQHVLSMGYRRMPKFGDIAVGNIRSMIGEGICLPVLAAVIYPLLLRLDFDDLWEH